MIDKKITAFLLVVRSIVTYVLWGLLALLYAPILFLFSLLPASVRYDNRLFFQLSAWWAKCTFSVAGIRVVITGREHLAYAPTVCVMNHGSAIDIFIIELLLGGQPRIWMSKMAYRWVPLLSTILQRMHVVIDVSSHTQAARGLAKMVTLTRGEGRHALLFPEGTRHTDDNIHKFYAGFVVLARKIERPVQPIYIRNAHRIFSPEGHVIDNRYPLEIIIGKTMTYKKNEENDAFVARVREWFCAQADAQTAKKQSKE